MEKSLDTRLKKFINSPSSDGFSGDAFSGEGMSDAPIEETSTFEKRQTTKEPLQESSVLNAKNRAAISQI